MIKFGTFPSSASNVLNLTYVAQGDFGHYLPVPVHAPFSS